MQDRSRDYSSESNHEDLVTAFKKAFRGLEPGGCWASEYCTVIVLVVVKIKFGCIDEEFENQKWSYNSIQTLSERARKGMAEDISKYPWFGMHDIVNIAFKVYEKWLDNQSHFDSGTAGLFLSRIPCQEPLSQGHNS